MFSIRTILSPVLAAAALAASASPALADPGDFNFGEGEVKTCTTGYAPRAPGKYGAYRPGCSRPVKCVFREGCTVTARAIVQAEQPNNRRVSLTSDLQLRDPSGTQILKRWPRRCDAPDACTTGHLDITINQGAVAALQCNGVHSVAFAKAKVTCLIQVSRGIEGTLVLRGVKPPKCAGADTPADQLPANVAENAMLCLTNVQRRKAGLPGLLYHGALTNAARGHAHAAAAKPWWDGSPRNHTNPYTGTTPRDRIVAAGYCPAAKHLNLDRAENTYTGGAWGTGAAAPTPRAAVTWWMTHHVADGQPPEANGHRMAILNPNAFEMGNGVALGVGSPSFRVDKGASFVQTFAACIN